MRPRSRDGQRPGSPSLLGTGVGGAGTVSVRRRRRKAPLLMDYGASLFLPFSGLLGTEDAVALTMLRDHRLRGER